MELNDTRAKMADALLDISRKIQRRFDDGYMPTFAQMETFKGAIEAFDVELLCGHKIVDECECDSMAPTTKE